MDHLTEGTVLLSRDGCHLCEKVEEEIRSVFGAGTSCRVIRIDGDPDLYERYLLRIPVVRVSGKEVFDAAMMDAACEWRKKLRGVLTQQRLGRADDGSHNQSS